MRQGPCMPRSPPYSRSQCCRRARHPRAPSPACSEPQPVLGRGHLWGALSRGVLRLGLLRDVSAVWGLLAGWGTLPAGHMGVAGGFSTRTGIKGRMRPRWGQEVVGTFCLVLVLCAQGPTPGQSLQLPGQACVSSAEHLRKTGHPQVLLSMGAGITVPHYTSGN